LLIDDLYAQPYGRAFLNNLEGTPQYLNWIAELLRPYLGDRILELGAGIGTLSGRLMGRRVRYVATERDSLYLHALRNRFLRTPNVSVREFDPGQPAPEKGLGGPFDTVLCINLLEYIETPAFLQAVADWTAPGGTLIVLVPQGRALFGTLDRTLGHQRRYSAAQLRDVLSEYGFQVERTRQLNKIGAPAWLMFSRLLHRRQINKLFLKVFDKTVWFWRRIDFLLPWPGLSLVAIAKKKTCDDNRVPAGHA
jgi:SAM-dependent methyltransferase